MTVVIVFDVQDPLRRLDACWRTGEREVYQVQPEAASQSCVECAETGHGRASRNKHPASAALQHIERMQQLQLCGRLVRQRFQSVQGEETSLVIFGSQLPHRIQFDRRGIRSCEIDAAQHQRFMVRMGLPVAGGQSAHEMRLADAGRTVQHDGTIIRTILGNRCQQDIQQPVLRAEKKLRGKRWASPRLADWSLLCVSGVRGISETLLTTTTVSGPG